jgi:sugar lactone lactonase YvrE
MSVSGTSYVQSSIQFSGLTNPAGVTVDRDGNLYLADDNRVLESPVKSANFGSSNVGSATLPRSFIFIYDGTGVPGTATVVTQGATGLDFSDKGTGTCITNGPTRLYVRGDTCTVDVVFSAKAPGARYGAVVFTSSVGAVMATGYAKGMGVAPQVHFLPGTQKNLSLGGVTPYAIATDASDNLYITQALSSNNPSNAVIKETWDGSGYTPAVIGNNFSYPVGVAVDGAGNVYVADQNNTRVTKWRPTGSTYTLSQTYSGLGNVESVAVDGSGNLYVGSLAYGLVLFPAGSIIPNYITRTVYSFGLAVDFNGVLYAASSNDVITETLTDGAFVQATIASNLNGPHGLTVDPNGNVYVTSTFGNQVVLLTRSGNGFSKSTVLSFLSNPLGVALDAAGNVYASSRNDARNALHSNPGQNRTTGRTVSEEHRSHRTWGSAAAAGRIEVRAKAPRAILPSLLHGCYRGAFAEPVAGRMQQRNQQRRQQRGSEPNHTRAELRPGCHGKGCRHRGADLRQTDA